jgi:DNA-directed RNA polymerase subunit RPC12/RpoP
MSYLKERVAYLKGLAEGMQISDSTNEGKLLKAIIDVLGDVALSVNDVEEVQEQLSEQVDEIDEDLGEIEELIFDGDYEDEEEDEGADDEGADNESEDDESEDEDDEECSMSEFECPHCGEKVDIKGALIDRDKNIIKCPHCGGDIEIEWDCDCDDCKDK